MAKKGPKTGKKTDEKPRERDAKGRFKKGSRPGPGRGKKKNKLKNILVPENPHEVYKDAIGFLYKALHSDDEKICLRAANILAMAFADYKANRDQVISDNMINLLGIGPNTEFNGDQNEDIIDTEDD